MICLICRQAETIERQTSINFGRGEMRLLIRNVPAHICPGCGEAYLDEEIAVRLLRQAEELSALGEFESDMEFMTR